MTSPLLELEHVTQRYGDVHALEDVSISVPTGETVALIGPSGGGKSTVLRLLTGLIEPSSGLVRFEGRPLEPASIRAARLRMGYVIQGGGLFPHLTAAQNVGLLVGELGWDARRTAERVEQLASQVRLTDDRLLRYPGELSGGQRQRVALMRALMLDPEVLLLDEPLGALDPITRMDLQEELKQLFTALKKTVVLVTHDLSEAAFLARRAVVLKAGRVVQDDLMGEVLRSPADEFVRRFVDVQRRVTGA